MPCGVRVTDRGLAPVTIETISGLAVIGRPTGPLGYKEILTLDWTRELSLRDVRQMLVGIPNKQWIQCMNFQN